MDYKWVTGAQGVVLTGVGILEGGGEGLLAYVRICMYVCMYVCIRRYMYTICMYIGPICIRGGSRILQGGGLWQLGG